MEQKSSAVQRGAVQCSAVPCSAVQCSAVQFHAVQCTAMHCTEYTNSSWLPLSETHPEKVSSYIEQGGPRSEKQNTVSHYWERVCLPRA